jgi:hypothetical protein
MGMDRIENVRVCSIIGGWGKLVIGANIGDFAGIPPMSAKRSTTDDPTNFSAFKITLITKEIYNFENR